MPNERLKHTILIEDLAWDVFSSQIAGEPHVRSWSIQDYVDVCLNYLKVSYLPESWILDLVAEVKKCQRGL